MADISLPAGQINIKGPQQPDVVNRWFATTTGIVFTGLVLTLGIGIDVPAGALVHTGYAVTEDSSFSNPGRMVWQGLTPSLAIQNTQVTVTPGAGALTLTGLAPALRIGDIAFDLPAGQIVIKGPARPQAFFAMPVGSLVYTGHVLVALVDTPGAALTIPAGSLVFTGQAPVRIVNQDLAIPVGSLVLTGGYVGVQFMQPAAGSLQFTGHAPSLAAQTYLIPVPRGRIEWGQAVLVPTVFQAHIRALGAGQVVLTGEELNVSTPGTIVLPTGALALTGQALTIDWGTGIPKGSLVFTGHALSFPATSVVHEIDGRGSFARKIYGRASSTTGSSGRGSL